MCGIVGYVGHQDAVPILIEGLHRLEYRGYDSSGLALHRKGELVVHKRRGKVREMESSLPKRFSGLNGIGHTRWATHGAPSDENAHPHTDSSGRVAVVHNGIIENAHELRSRLEAEGVAFASETDTEVLAQLIARVETDSLQEAVRIALKSVTGTYGLAVIDARHPQQIVAARNGSPVILGVGEKEMFVASDTSRARAPHAAGGLSRRRRDRAGRTPRLSRHHARCGARHEGADAHRDQLRSSTAKGRSRTS